MGKCSCGGEPTSGYEHHFDCKGFHNFDYQRRLAAGPVYDGVVAATRQAIRGVSAAPEDRHEGEETISVGKHSVPPIESLDQVHPQLLKAAALLNQKGRDYGDVNECKSQYHPFGDASYLQMLHLKLERAKTFAGWGPDGFKREHQTFDSQRDNIIDLINYAAFYAEWLEQQEQQEAASEPPASPAVVALRERCSLCFHLVNAHYEDSCGGDAPDGPSCGCTIKKMKQ